MDVQVSTHAVTRSVQVVQSLAPHRCPCQDVNLRAAGPTGEFAQLYLDVPFQHQRIDQLLLVGQRSEGNGASDVGRAVQVLRTAVEQKQSVRLQGNVGLGRRLVMDNGSMCAVARNRVERDVAVEWLLGAQCRQFPVDGNLRFLMPILPTGLIQPLQELNHGDAVFQHRRLKTRYLGGVLHGLHPLDGRFFLHLLAGNSLIECIVHLVGVEQDVILEVALQATDDILVVVDLDALLPQVGRHLGRQLHLIYI